MAAPSFVQASAGVVVATGSSSVSLSGAVAGNLVILHVLNDGTSTISSLSGITNIENLSGTLGAMDQLHITGWFIGGAGEASHQIFMGRVRANGTASLTLATGGDDSYGRLYEFSGVATGSSPYENITDGGFTETSDTTTTINQAGITTLGADRLCLCFVAVNDDNALDAFTGMSGGTWAEAVAEFASATGTDGAIGLQIATKATAGLISSGSDVMAAADAWGTVGLALKPVATGANWSQPLSDTITLSDAVAKTVGKKPSDTVTLSDAISRVWAAVKSLSDTITLADALGKTYGLKRSDSYTLADALSTVIGRTLSLSDTLTLTDALARGVGLGKADTVTLADAISRAWVAKLTQNDSLTLSDSLTKKAVGKGLADALTLVEAVSKRPVSSRADSITLTDALSRVWAAKLSRADSLTLSDALAKGLVLSKADAITLVDLATPNLSSGATNWTKALADTITVSDAISKAFAAAKADQLTLADAFAKKFTLSKADSMALADAVAKAIGAGRSDSLTLSDAVGKAIGQHIDEAITVLDNLSKSIALTREDVTLMSDALVKSLNGVDVDAETSLVVLIRQIFLNRFGIY